MQYLLLCILILLPSHVAAQEMYSPSYKLELEQIEATTEAKQMTLNPLQEKQFFENGYIIHPPQDNSLQFSISDVSLNLNAFSEEPVQYHSVVTTITSQQIYGYQMLINPLQGLETKNADQIPATQCDGKDEFCTTHIAGEWKNNSRTGWGYNISGPDANLDFKNDTYFRPFTTGEAIVMATNDASEGQQATKMTIKTIISPEQAEGNYSSLIKIIALPKL